MVGRCETDAWTYYMCNAYSTLMFTARWALCALFIHCGHADPRSQSRDPTYMWTIRYTHVSAVSVRTVASINHHSIQSQVSSFINPNQSLSIPYRLLVSYKLTHTVSRITVLVSIVQKALRHHSSAFVQESPSGISSFVVTAVYWVTGGNKRAVLKDRDFVTEDVY